MATPSASQVQNAAVPWWKPQESADGAIAAADPGTGAARRSSSLAFGALMCFTFILLAAPQGIFPSLKSLRIAFVSGVVAAVAHLADRFLGAAGVRGFDREAKIALLLFVWAFVTVPFCYWPGGSLDFLISFYLKTLLIFWLLSSAVDTPSRMHRTLWLLNVLMATVALSSLFAYRGGEVLEAAGFARITGYDAPLTANPNDLALMLSLVMPLSMALVFGIPGIGSRAVLYGFVAVFVSTIILTFSRAGFLDLAVMAVLLFAKQRKQSRSGWGIGIAVALVALMFVMPENYGDRLATIYNISQDATGSASARWEGMVAAVRFVAKHPIFGAGAGMGVLALNEEQGAVWKDIHNVYLQIAVELGIPGLLLYLTLILRAIHAARAAQRRFVQRGMQAMAYVAEGLEISLTVFAVGGFFSPVAYHYYLYYMAGLALAARGIASGGDAEVTVDRPGFRPVS